MTPAIVSPVPTAVVAGDPRGRRRRLRPLLRRRRLRLPRRPRGLPTVILGPDGENIHGAGEFVYTDEVVEVADIVTDAGARLLD
jgi:hypothetical protein